MQMNLSLRSQCRESGGRWRCSDTPAAKRNRDCPLPAASKVRTTSDRRIALLRPPLH